LKIQFHSEWRNYTFEDGWQVFCIASQIAQDRTVATPLSNINTPPHQILKLLYRETGIVLFSISVSGFSAKVRFLRGQHSVKNCASASQHDSQKGKMIAHRGTQAAKNTHLIRQV
jgi:hypothetical protein